MDVQKEKKEKGWLTPPQLILELFSKPQLILKNPNS